MSRKIWEVLGVHALCGGSWVFLLYYSFVAGNALSLGLIGAVTAGPPLRFLMDTYEAGFIPMMVWACLSVLLLFFTRETHCRQMG